MIQNLLVFSITQKKKKGITLQRIRQEVYKETRSISRRNCSTDQTTRIP